MNRVSKCAEVLVIRLEPVLMSLFLVCWLLDFLVLMEVIRLAGSLDLALYPLYTMAAVSGWLSGNVYLHRSADLPRAIRRRLLLAYFLGPLGFLYLLRTMAPLEVQAAAPLVPMYSFGVFTIFFLVPTSLRGTLPSRRRLKINPPRREEDECHCSPELRDEG